MGINYKSVWVGFIIAIVGLVSFEFVFPSFVEVDSQQEKTEHQISWSIGKHDIGATNQAQYQFTAVKGFRILKNTALSTLSGISLHLGGQHAVGYRQNRTRYHNSLIKLLNTYLLFPFHQFW